jgi:hypothetical protein
MGRLLLLLIGALAGAALFHIYYRVLEPAARCGWDHPLDQGARSACRTEAATPSATGYSPKARHELDDLVGKVTH